MPGIKDKIIVITGASSGIGEATAVMLAERGAKVVLGARGIGSACGSKEDFMDTFVYRAGDKIDPRRIRC